jgi:hypothetical protein
LGKTIITPSTKPIQDYFGDGDDFFELGNAGDLGAPDYMLLNLRKSQRQLAVVSGYISTIPGRAKNRSSWMP